MTQTDGERELVLGNRQLVSFFFVVLALCGVFFALGYMIGRNSSKTTVIGSDSSAPGINTATVSPIPKNEAAEQPREQAEAPRAVETSPAAQTEAARELPLHDAPSHDAPVREALSREAPVQEVPVREAAAPEPDALYLQVTALRRADAANLVKTLREQNLPALLNASSKPELFRVMVGPYHQTAQVADAKAHLKTLGFGDSIVKKASPAGILP